MLYLIMTDISTLNLFFIYFSSHSTAFIYNLLSSIFTVFIFNLFFLPFYVSRRALCDPLSSVRQAAAQTFDSLHGTVGFRALEDILPHLLAQLENEDESREFALDGLKQVMAIKSRVVLPYLVPQVGLFPFLLFIVFYLFFYFTPIFFNI